MKLNSKEGKNKDQDHFDPRLLEKFYRGECTREEKEQMEAWFISLDNRKEINRKALAEWEKTPDTGNRQDLLEKILYKIHYNLRIEEYEQEKEKGRTVRLKRIIASVAVSIMLIVAGYWFGNTQMPGGNNVYSELHAPYGSRIRFELPDGSRGWLNGGSSLRYSVRFTGRKRMVSLVGEGYFNVKHNPSKPFIVQTGHSRIIALGTSFNVQAFNDTDEEVTLVKGKVVVEESLSNGKYKHLVTMKPGQHIQLDAARGQIVFQDQDVDKYVAWKDGKLVFRNDPLSRVVREMEHYYNVDIEVEDQDLYRYHFHATFENETLFEALRLLTLSSAIDYKICKREKNPDGTFKKRKVILYKKKI